MILKSLLCTMCVAGAALLPAQTDSFSAQRYSQRYYVVLGHLINIYQPAAIAGWEFRFKGPHALALEGAYMFGVLQTPPSHGYRFRAAYRYYLSRRDPQADPVYLGFMAAWQQRFQRAAGWYDRFDGLYQEYLTGDRTWNAVRFNIGIGFLNWGKKNRYVEFLIAPGIRWVYRSSYNFPSDVRTDDNPFDSLEDNKWLGLPDLTFHFSFGKSR